MTVTIREIAKTAGVAIGTASRALNSQANVAPKTREKVLAAAKALNYMPNAQARSLRKDRTHTLGLVIPDVRNPFFAELAYFAEKAARLNGYSLILASAEEDPDLMLHYTRNMQSQRVDGLILAPFSSAGEAIAELSNSSTQVVFVDRYIPEIANTAVVSDTQSAIDSAFKFLQNAGVQKIGFLAGPSDTSTGVERLQEVEQAAQKHHLSLEVESSHFNEASGEKATVQLLSKQVDALIAGDTLLTQGALQSLQSRGLKINQDLHFIGFDNPHAVKLMPEPFPMINQDIEKLATLAISAAIQTISGEQEAELIRIPAVLYLNQSPNFTGEGG